MWLGYGVNEYGTQISRHVCDTCGEPFTVCPAIPPDEVEERGWESCLSKACDSYDPLRDVDLIMGWCPSEN